MSVLVRRGALVLVGLWAGLMATVVHRHAAEVAGHEVRWGLVVAVALTFVIAVGAEVVTRLGTAFFAVGWSGALVLPMVAGGASYLVADDAVGWIFMLAGVGALVLALVLNPRLVP